MTTFQGLYTALVTPFDDGRLDEPAFRRLVETQITAGVTGIVPVGTTGESPTLDHDEHLRIIELAVKHAAGKVQVVAGTGANATAEALSLTKEAQHLGATGSLQVCPYYNKPSQEGIYAHYRTIAEATKLPIMLYSIPGRSVIEIATETAARLAKDCPNIVGIKEAGGSVDRVSQLQQVLPESCSILCGDDGLTLPFMACGAKGLVSVTSNLLPKMMKQLVDACLAGDYASALQVHHKYYPLMKGIMGLDTNPVPIKAALALTGAISPSVRLPLVPLHADKTAQLATLLKQFSII